MEGKERKGWISDRLLHGLITYNIGAEAKYCHLKNLSVKVALRNSSQSWVENTHMTDSSAQSINSSKHLPQSPFTGKFFLDDDILL